MNRLGVIELAFDPLIELGEISLPLQTLGITLGLLIAVTLAARYARTMKLPARRSAYRPRYPPAPNVGVRGGPVDEPLRLDDLAYIVLAAVPGAVIGGRLVHVFAFWSYYAEDPARLLDPSVGTLSLLGAVLGGALTGGYMAYLLGSPVRRWADAAAVPLLVALGLGKFAQLLGGSGQGAPFEGPWAVAVVGAGPWISANPELPSHPAQVYEGLWLLIGLLLVLSLASTVRSARRWQGGLFLAALLVFLFGRLVVGFSWRDEAVAGLLNAEQLLAIVALQVLLLGLVLGAWLRSRERPAAGGRVL